MNLVKIVLDVISWLLEGEAYIEYRTRLDLILQGQHEPEVVDAMKRMIADPKIKHMLSELKNWPGQVLNSHKSASQPFHRLSFIADLGFTKKDPGIAIIAEKIFDRQDKEGPFQLTANYPEHFGGSGTDVWAWALCDAPVTIYSLAKLGYRDDSRVQKAADYLAGLAYPNGWHCTVSKELGNFRGPGKKEDPCPYATLVMLKMLAQFPQYYDDIEISGEADTEKEEKKKGYVFRERGYASFYKRIAFPENVIPERAESSMKDGLLQVDIPKKMPTPELKKHKVTVK